MKDEVVTAIPANKRLLVTRLDLRERIFLDTMPSLLCCMMKNEAVGQRIPALTLEICEINRICKETPFSASTELF